MENGLLLYLVADLMRDEGLRSRFRASPETVMDEYELNGRQKCILFGMQSESIASAILEEFSVNSIFIGGAPLRPEWPGPHPEVRAFHPTSAGRGLVEVEVRGEGLLTGATVRLVPAEDAGAVAAQAVAPEAEGSFREKKFVVKLDLSNVTPGQYFVEVQNCSDAKPLRSLDKFTVVEK